MRTSPPHDLPAAALDALRQDLAGEVQAARRDRGLHAADASVFEQWPLAVARPRHAADLATCVRWAAAHQVPITARAAGTSLAGQTTGGGLIVDSGRFMVASGKPDLAARRIRVEPGVILDDLNDGLAPTGFFFAPDTSTSNRCMIGGMIGNNSCGSHSCVHGTTREHVLAIEAVLTDGSRLRAEDLDAEALAERCRRPGLEGRIHRGLLELIGSHRDLILARSPRPEVNRRNTGYALDRLAQMQPWNPAGSPFNLSALLCGSEGTLALTAAAELRLVPRPRHRRLCAVHFASLVDACRAAVLAGQHHCHAAELIGGEIVAAARKNREQSRNAGWIEGEPGAVCAIELEDGDEAVLETRMAALVAALREQGLGHAWPVLSGSGIAQVWAVRKAGLGLLMGIPTERRALAVIEDAAVAPADLPAYAAELLALAARMDIRLVFFGHAAAGEIHFRPCLDLRDPADARRFEELAARVAELVARFRGSLSGEHGDGRLRSPFLATVLGPELLALNRQVKELFDPQGILNPGKITDPEPFSKDWRLRPGTDKPEPATHFDFSASLGLVGAVEQCNGAGVCRTSPGRGTMCPSWQATREELHTTRGRANLLRQLLQQPDPLAALCHDDAAAALELCLGCKACASECPANVDMARIKAEVLQQRHDRLGVPAADARFGRFTTWARRARLAPRLASRLADSRWMKQLLGIDPRRSVPPFATETASAWWRRNGSADRQGARQACLVVDEFSEHLEPGIVQAAVKVLHALGWGIELVVIDSARAAISRGLLREAIAVLPAAVSILTSAMGRGATLIGLEPSAVSVFWDEAPDLLRGALREQARSIRNSLRLLDAVLAEEAPALARLPWQVPAGTSVLVHGHCHQKALRSAQPSRDCLAAVPGVTVKLLDTGCCGMAGSFGYEHYDVSMDIAGLQLLPALDAAPDALIAAPGHSCRHQIHDGAGRRARHPVEWLAEWLGSAR